MKVKCDFCSKEFDIFPYALKRTKLHFCSRECYSEFRPKPALVKCLFCKKEFKKNLSQIEIYKNHFCSKECHIKHYHLPNIIEERFFKYIEKQENGCWIWTGHVKRDGYGASRHIGKYVLSHRLSWIIHNGEIPKGMFILHKCDVRSCVNPEHLFLGTHQDNMDDMINKKRDRHLKGEDSALSKLTDENVREIRSLYKSGKFTQEELANKFPCSRANMSSIILRKIWRHLEDC